MDTDQVSPCTELVPAEASAIAPAILGPDELVDAFLRGKDPNTLRAYDSDLRDFAGFLRIPHADARKAMAFLLSLTAGNANAVVLEYRTHLQRRELSPSTIGRRLAAIRSCVKLARTVGAVAWTIEIESPKVERYRDTRGPGLEGWKAMRATAAAMASLGSAQAVRDLAIVQTLRGLALRRSELIGLDLVDVELDDDPPGIWIVGKGHSQRERLTLPNSAIAAMRDWLKVRGDWPGPVFVRLDRAATSPDRLTDRSVGNIVPALAHRAGIRRRIKAHGLRHEAITTALDVTGGDVRKVQRFSRHADLRTLTMYDDRRRDGAGDVARLIDDEG